MNAGANIHTPRIKILSLYPRELSSYGDTGNLLVLRKRAEWRGMRVEVVDFEPGAPIRLLEDINLIIGGGGEDRGQATITADLLRIGSGLRELIENDVPALVVCGCFELFGNCITRGEEEATEGIGVFDMHTLDTDTRLVGNIVTTNTDFGELVGYENHRGRTYLAKGQEPLSRVVNGAGNNGEDDTEGARYRYALGTYLHGPLLPKNPQVADFLIRAALEHRYGSAEELAPLPDPWVEPARKVARNRLR